MEFSVTVKKEGRERDTVIKKVNALSNYSLELSNMNRCIRGTDTPLITEEFSMKNVRLLDEILKKAGY